MPVIGRSFPSRPRIGRPPLASRTLSTLVDNFDDNSVDTARWTGVSNAADRREQNGRLGLRASAAGANAWTSSAAAYSFDSIYLRLFPTGELTTATSYIHVTVYSQAAGGPGTDAEMSLEANGTGTVEIAMRLRISGSVSSAQQIITYSATDHAWWRIRRSAGNVLWDTAPDDGTGNPGTWTNRHSVAEPAWAGNSDCALFLEAERASGTDDWAEFDGVNTVALAAFTRTVDDSAGFTDSATAQLTAVSPPTVTGTPQGFSFAATTTVTYTGGGATGTTVWDVLCVASDTTVSTPAGWTLQESRVVNEGAYIFVRNGGVTSATITLGLATNTRVSWVRITDATAVDTPVDSNAGVDGVNGTTTPALTTPALSTATELVVAFAGLTNFTTTPTGLTWSSGYTAAVSGGQGTGAQAAFGAVATKTPAGAAAESPSLTWTNAANNRYLLVIAFTGVVAGIAFTATVNDLIGATDSRALAQTATAIDTAGLADTRSVDVAKTVTDSAGLTDTAAPSSDLTRTITDNTGITDGSATVTRTVARTDPLGLTDAASSQLTAGGTALTRTADDSAGVTDARAVAQAATATDSAGLTDTAAASTAAARTVSDSAGLTDAVTAAFVSTIATRTVTDSAGLTDGGVASDYAWTQDDSAGLADTVAVLVAREVTVTDTAGLADTATITAVYVRSQADSAGLTDATTTAVAGAGTRTADDSAGLSDSRVVDLAKVLTDTAGLTDAAQQIRLSVATVTDTAGLADAATAAADFAATVTDTAGLTDSTAVEAAGATSRTVDDSAGLTDARALSQTATADDSAGLTDTRAVAQTAAVSDSAGLTDTVVQQTAAAGVRTVDDTVGLTDSRALAQTATVADGAGLTDAATTATDIPRTLTDSAGMSDAAAVETGKAATVTDTAGLTDTRTTAIVFGRTVDDGAGLADTIARVMVGGRTADDTAGLTDTAVPASVVLRTLTDTAGLTDLAAGGLASLLDQRFTDSAGLVDAVLAVNVLQPTVYGEPVMTGDEARPTVTGDRVPVEVA